MCIFLNLFSQREMASKPGHASQHHISDTDSDATIDPTDNDNISFSDEETRKDFDHTPSKSKGKVKLGNKDKSFSKLEASLHDISSSDSDATVDLSFDSGSKSKRTERKNISKKGLPVTSPVQNKSSEKKTRDSVISDSDSDDATSYLFKSSPKTFHEKPSSCPKKAISDSDSDDATSYLFKSSPSEKKANPSYNGKKKTGNTSNEPSTVMSTKRNPLHAKRTAKDNIISDSDSDDATSYLFKSSPKKENLKKDKSTSKTTVPAPTSTLSNTAIGNSASLGKQLCPYGVKCYRKNPSHFEEFKHSGKLTKWSFGDNLTSSQLTRNIDPMLGQCRKRWAKIKPALGHALIFAGFLASLIFFQYIPFHFLPNTTSLRVLL